MKQNVTHSSSMFRTTVGTVTRNKFFLRVDVGDHVLTLFPDGRAIVKGTEEIAVAKRIYAQYIGN